MEQTKEALISKGIKPTFQRLAILDYIKEKYTHPTVDSIFKDLSKDIPTMSKTTIYNTLDMFVKNDLARSISISNSEIRYDGDIMSHHHFICNECGNIIDINICCPQINVGNIHGNLIKEVHGYFKGICVKCQKNIKKGDK